ncbi:hypothetical protein NA63_1415 [Flavobacteriaceae bacterium MAR_2010_105]|nr:hypothetical protein NA63_1415 [Flavobacteriaceae bacterium MAR_2010_105]
MYIYILKLNSLEMKKSLLIVLAILLLQFKLSAQENINNYKYVIVPTSYDFLEGQDRYQLNSLTKFLFNKYGFTAFFQNEDFPQDLRNNRCLAMFVNVEKEKGFLRTKLRIDLLDCNGNLVTSSRVGSTNEKEFDKAYNLALRDAFETFQHIDYSYQPSKTTVASTAVEPAASENLVEKEKEIERLQDELKSLKEEKKEPVKTNEAPVPVVKEEPKIETIVEEGQPKVVEANIEVKEASDLLYAQPIANGFQVVDLTPKIVMVLLETAKTDTFLVKDDDAIVYKENGLWYLSRNDGSKVSIEPLNIKF